MAKKILIGDHALRGNCDKGIACDKFSLDNRMGNLVEAILSPEAETPFTVAITGDWGSGKTSAMACLEDLLIESGKSKYRTQVTTCWLKPWKYQTREDVLKGLLFEVISQAKEENTLIKAGAVLLAVGAGVFNAFAMKGIQKDQAEVSTQGAVTGSITEATAVYDGMIHPELRHTNAFEASLKDIVSKKFNKYHRLVLFVDDLDRCLPHVALQVLEAIKLYLDIDHVVFVVGVDRKAIDHIVESHYLETHKPGDNKEIREQILRRARKYLDKMFQVEFEAPPNEGQVDAFLKDQLEAVVAFEKLAENDKNIIIAAIRSIGGLNPRAIIRAINTGIVQSSGDDLAQSMQRSLVRSICSRLSETEYFEGVEELARTMDGNQFFCDWSRLVRDDINQQHYWSGDEDKLEEDRFAVLVRKYPEWKKLLTHKSIGICMEIEWPSAERAAVAPTTDLSEDEAFAQMVEVIKTERGAPNLDVVELQTETSLDLRGSGVTDAMLRGLVKFPRLTNLLLFNTAITDAGVVHLKELKQLTSLFLSETQITDAGVAHLKEMKQLTTLLLSVMQITDAGVVHLKELKQLTSLFLSETQITDAGVAHLKEMKQLTRLDLSGTQITDAGVAHLKGLEQLTALFLSRTQITDAAVAHLKEMKQLTGLGLSGTRITDAGVAHLKEMKQLTWLYLSGTQITDAGVAHLKVLKQLTVLGLSETPITDAGVAHLKEMKQLRRLDLTRTQITNAAVVHLKEMTQLTVLDVSGTQITPKGIQKLKAALPKCNILK